MSCIEENERFKSFVEWSSKFDGELKRIKEDTRFSILTEQVLEEHIQDSLSDVTRYSTEKLAGILSGCAEWRVDYPRQDTDWFFAERVLNEHGGEDMMKEYSEKLLIIGAVEAVPQNIRRALLNPTDDGKEYFDRNAFQRNCFLEPKDLFEKLFAMNLQPPRDNWGLKDNNSPHYWLAYKRRLGVLPEREIAEYLQEGRKKLPNNMDLFLGRGIWEIYIGLRDHGHKELPREYGVLHS
ncbi:MAG: hypothetical protein ABIB79_02670 [archaeon]